MKVLVFPFNSLILSDLVLRRGHEPLTSMKCIEERVKDGLKKPPFNIFDEDLVKALKFAPADMPAGAKGRISLLAPLIHEAEAALVMEGAEACFGPSGCLRANMALLSLLKKRGIPILKVGEPRSIDEAKNLLEQVDKFLGKPIYPTSTSTISKAGKSQTMIVRIYPAPKVPTYPSIPLRIAIISCGLEYSGVFSEVVEAIRSVGAEPYIPEYSKEYVKQVERVFGVKPVSGDLRVLLAQALSLLDMRMGVKGALLMTCFRCGEGSLIRSMARSLIVERLKIPVVAYSFTERTRDYNLRLRIEALYNLISKKSLYKKPPGGLALGLDSGSTYTKAVVYDGKEILGYSWRPTIDIERDAEKATKEALDKAGISISQLDAIGATGYGRFRISKLHQKSFVVDDVNSSALGALLLSGFNRCLILDVGGTDTKAMSIRDMNPTGFSLGEICAGASGRFLEIVASRLGVSIKELGEMALERLETKVTLNAYCAVFGLQDVVALLAKGVDKRDIAAAACKSIAEQICQQFLGDVDVVDPIIHVGGASLVKGLTEALKVSTGLHIVVPRYSQFAGAIGAAAMALNAGG